MAESASTERASIQAERASIDAERAITNAGTVDQVDPVGAVEPASAGGGTGSSGALASPEVRLSVPAHGAFLGLIRTTSAAVAARLDMTIDEIEDLRIAVDEAAAILLPYVADDRSVDVVFTLGDDALTIALSAETGDAGLPDQGGFGWTVLSALVGSVRADQHDGRTTILLSHRRRALT